MAAAITEENVQKTVYEALPQFGRRRVRDHRDATFEDLDVDSLDLAELSQIIEDEYGVALKGDDVGKIKTVGDAIIWWCRRLEPEVVITASALSPRSGSAQRRCTSAGAPASSASPTARARPRVRAHRPLLRSRRPVARTAFTQFALVAGDEALAEAGWTEELPSRAERSRRSWAPDRRHRHARACKEISSSSGPKKVPPLSVPLMMSNAAAAAVSMRYKLLGPCHGIVSACSGGGGRIGAAKMMISPGHADAGRTRRVGGALGRRSRTPRSRALDALSQPRASRAR
jgi:acyl carrier protein